MSEENLQELDSKYIRNLQNTADDFYEDDFIAVDGTHEGSRKMPQSVLKQKLREDCLGNIHNLPARSTFESDDKFVVDSATNGTGAMSKDVLLAKTAENALGSIKNLQTSITAFRSGDVIPVDGPSGTAKMSKDSLLSITAQNPIAGWWNFAKTITTANAFALDKNLVQGEQYIVYRGSHDITKVSFLEDGHINAQDVSFGDEDFVIFTANSEKKYVYPTSSSSQYGDVIVGNSSLIFSAIKKIQSDLSALSSSTSASVSRISTILGTWNFARDITSQTSYRLDTDLTNGKSYLVWRSSSNITRISFLNSSYQNAQDVVFGEDNYKIITANSDKRYLYPTSTDYSEGYVLVADVSIIHCIFKEIENIKTILQEINENDRVFDKLVPASDTYRQYSGISLRAGVEYVVEADPAKVSKLIFLTSGYLNAETVNITSSNTKFSLSEDKGVVLVYLTADASVIIHDISVATPYTNRFLINESVYEEVYRVGSDREVTSFTQMLLNLQGNTHKKVIYIDSGVYDIFEEIGGADFASAITGSADDWRNNSVIVPPNTRIVGLGNVIFNFLPENADISSIGAQQLSPLNIDNNVEVENITINADNCRYCIHSEDSHLERNYYTKKVFKNVVLNKYHTDKGWNQAFGCGFSKGSKFDFDGCIFTSWNQPISFHDGPMGQYGGATINIRNCIFRTTNESQVYALNFAEMSGAQTHHQVILSNCRLNQPIRINRSLDYVTHNSYDVKAIGCGTVSFSVSDLFEDNIYPPEIL